jgi:hypothetical protein
MDSRVPAGALAALRSVADDAIDGTDLPFTRFRRRSRELTRDQPGGKAILLDGKSRPRPE